MVSKIVVSILGSPKRYLKFRCQKRTVLEVKEYPLGCQARKYGSTELRSHAPKGVYAMPSPGNQARIHKHEWNWKVN